MKVINKKGVPHDLAQFANVMKVNTVGTFNVLRLAAESMSKNKNANVVNEGCKGVIINTASIAAMDGQMGQAREGGTDGRMDEGMGAKRERVNDRRLERRSGGQRYGGTKGRMEEDIRDHERSCSNRPGAQVDKVAQYGR